MLLHEAAAASPRRAPKGIHRKDGTFKSGKKWARRHVLSSYDMKAHYEAALIKPHKTVEQAGKALENRGHKPASDAKTAIQPAAQALLKEFHNNASNLWIGETRENSRLQENVDAAPEMYEKTGELRVKALEKHLQMMASTYGIPGPVKVTVSNESLGIKSTYEVKG
jgi:hypothetical protein